MLRSYYLLGASVVIGVIILYLVNKQKKEIERLSMAMETRVVETQQNPNILTSHQFMTEMERINQKMDKSYDNIHKQYEQVLVEMDQIVEFLEDDGDNSENIRSYHCEDLIDIPNNESNHAIVSNGEETVPSIPVSDDNTEKNSRTIVEEEKSKSIKSNNSSQKEESVKNCVSENAISDNLIADNLIAENMEEDLTSIQTHSTTTNYPKLPELRQLCKERNLPYSGNKSVLINRLKDNGYDF